MAKTFDTEMLNTLKYWVVERERVRKAKEAGLPKPWTKDVLIANHRWCNVRRADDKVSRWLLDNWYDGHNASPRSLVIAAALARLINWPDTLFELMVDDKPFTKWNASAVRNKLAKWQGTGNKVFTGAYIINGAAGGSKVDQVVRHVQVLATTMRGSNGRPVLHADSMEHTWAELIKCPGIGSFMAGQIVADLRYVLPGAWSDRMQWAPLGPGSTRGMRRLLALEPRGAMRQGEFNVLLPKLIELLQRDRKTGVVFADRKLEAMDIQNCLCEFDKYVRLKTGTGHVRSKYPGAA